jgi:endonuclease YncB( thermonuclease family)
MTSKTLLAAALVASIAFSAAQAAETLSGPSRVLDGDTVVVGGIHVRLKGVDAAERGTVRGDDATAIMRSIVGNSYLTCQLTGEKTWRREVGFCFTADGRDIQREIVEMGAALACARYSTRYVSFEQPDAVAVQPRSSYCIRR